MRKILFEKNTMPKEVAKGLSSQLRKALEKGDLTTVQEVCSSALGRFAPQSLLAFPVGSMPVPTSSTPPPVMSPEQEKQEKLYSNIATNIWRIKNQIIDIDNGEPKEALSEREIAKIARYINSLETAMVDGGVEVVGDYVGKPHREGSAVKVISYEDRKDLSRYEYVEVLMPTVRWTNAQGETRLLQPAEVVVGRPLEASTEISTELN